MRNSHCIDGIPQLTWRDKDMPCAGSLEAATAPTPNPLSYDEVLAYTGYAMTFRWWVGGPKATQKWCLSSMDIGYDAYDTSELDAITRCTGLGLAPLWYKADMTEDEHERLFRKLTESIDAGNAVLCSPFGNMSVIAGYEEDGRTLRVHQYGKGEPASMSLKRISGPSYLVFLEQASSPANNGASALDAATSESASLCARKPVPYEEGEYHFGASAWREVLTSMSDLDSLSEDDRTKFISTLDFALWRVQDCRKAALRFLARYGNGGQRWGLDKATALAGCLLKELDHFSTYSWDTEDTVAKRDAILVLVEAMSESDAQVLRIGQPEQIGS